MRGTGSGYALVATSTLGINTSDITEGSNLFWTNDRFDNRLSATTTLPNLTTLLGLTNATSTNLTTTNSWLGTARSGLWNGTSIGNQYGGTNIDSSSLTGLAQMVSGVWSASSTPVNRLWRNGLEQLADKQHFTWQRIGQDFHHHRRNGRLCFGFVRRRSHLAGHFHFIQHHRHPSRGQRRDGADFIRTRLAQFGRDDFVGKHKPDGELPNRHFNDGLHLSLRFHHGFDGKRFSLYRLSLNGPLQANGGLVSATTSVGYQYGGTGLTAAPSFGQILRNRVRLRSCRHFHSWH